MSQITPAATTILPTAAPSHGHQKQAEPSCVRWCQVDVGEIYRELERPNWAPWLQASAQSLQLRSLMFPREQLALVDDRGSPIATLSLARITWDGDVRTLPHWDDIALDPYMQISSFCNDICDPDGNTLVAMSMNVHRDWQGLGLATVLLRHAQGLATASGTDHLIGSFRPNNFGQYKLDCFGKMDVPMPFSDYCEYQIGGAPRDGWLRSLTRLGMKPLGEDTCAMKVTIGLGEFETHAALYNPNRWTCIGVRDGKEVWECGEVGVWTVDRVRGEATYQESNLWGRLPL